MSNEKELVERNRVIEFFAGIGIACILIAIFCLGGCFWQIDWEGRCTKGMPIVFGSTVYRCVELGIKPSL